MDTLWVGTDPNPTETRTAAVDRRPQHRPTALTLLAASSQWHDAPRAARSAAEPSPSFDTASSPGDSLVGAPLREVLPEPRPRRRRRGASDLHGATQLVPMAVAR
jgi:hypothetical protein